MATRLHFRCVSVTEELSADSVIWRIRLLPTPFPADQTNGTVKYGGLDGGEFILTVFDKALARSFQVGEFYGADFERVDRPGR